MSTPGVFPSPKMVRNAANTAGVRRTAGGKAPGGMAPGGSGPGEMGPGGNMPGRTAPGGMPPGGSGPAGVGSGKGSGRVEPWNQYVSANEVQPSSYAPGNHYPRINNTNGQQNCAIVTIASIRRAFDSASNVTDIEARLRMMKPPMQFNWGLSGPFNDAEIYRMVKFLDKNATWVNTGGAPPQQIQRILDQNGKTGTFGLTFGRRDNPDPTKCTGHVVMGMYNKRQQHITWRDFQGSHIGANGEADTMNPTNDTGGIFWYPGLEM